MGLFSFIKEKMDEADWEPSKREAYNIWGIDLNNYGGWDTRWLPPQLILYKYIDGHMVRKEFYEFSRNKWIYMGYLSKKQCLDFYWTIKIKDGSYEGWERNDHDIDQADSIMEIELGNYFDLFGRLDSSRAIPNDGAVITTLTYRERDGDSRRKRARDRMYAGKDWYKS